jgi:predicted transporter
MAANKLSIILYSVLVFVIVSLDKTYSITNKFLGKLVGASDKISYGSGNSFGNKGFLLHILVYALLIGAPMYFVKNENST